TTNIENAHGRECRPRHCLRGGYQQFDTGQSELTRCRIWSDTDLIYRSIDPYGPCSVRTHFCACLNFPINKRPGRLIWAGDYRERCGVVVELLNRTVAPVRTKPRPAIARFDIRVLQAHGIDVACLRQGKRKG